jgi:hypothetical protein
VGETPPFPAVIYIDHKKKVDLGVLRGADHDGCVPIPSFSTVDGVCVKFYMYATLCFWGGGRAAVQVGGQEGWQGVSFPHIALSHKFVIWDHKFVTSGRYVYISLYTCP